MKIEKRNTFGKPSLILLPENEEESQLIDMVLGDRIPVDVVGEALVHSRILVTGQVRLSDDYGEHYICLRREEKASRGSETN